MREPYAVPAPAPEASACDNCGAALAGEYCHDCGARRPAADDLSLRRFAGETAEELTSLEHSKLLRTLAALLFRPGRLTAEYFTGRRIRYMKPVTLCLTILAAHLFAYSFSNTVSLFDIGRASERSEAYLRSMHIDAPNRLSADIRRTAASRRVTVASVEERINDRWASNLSLLQIPLILLFAGVLKLAYLRSRRYAVEHWIFAIHFISFATLLLVLMWPLYYVFGVDLSGLAGLLAGVNTLIPIAYLFLAARAFYGDSRRKALLRAPLLYAGYFICFSLVYQAAMLLALRSVLLRNA